MWEPSDEMPFPSPARSLSIQFGPDGDRVRLAVSGEFCLDDSQQLQHALRDALSRSTAGVDLELGSLAVADCSVLNVLLAARNHAVAAGKTITLGAASPAVQRLLMFTDTYAFFSGPSAERADDGLPQTEVVQLRRALRTRPDIDLARGILMATFGLSSDAAWEVLVMTSQNTNTKLHHLARDVVRAVRGRSLPDPVQRRLTTAVAMAQGAEGQPPSPPSGARKEAIREAV